MDSLKTSHVTLNYKNIGYKVINSKKATMDELYNDEMHVIWDKDWDYDWDNYDGSGGCRELFPHADECGCWDCEFYRYEGSELMFTVHLDVMQELKTRASLERGVTYSPPVKDKDSTLRRMQVELRCMKHWRF